MPKEEWGVKRLCPSCATRYYDLQRDPMVCPSCGHSVSLESLTNPKGRPLVAAKPDAKAKPEAAEDDSDDLLIDDDDDGDASLDDDVLDDDDDDDVSLDDITDVAAEDDD